MFLSVIVISPVSHRIASLREEGEGSLRFARMGFEYDIRVKKIVIVGGGRIIEKRFKPDRAIAVCRVMHALVLARSARGESRGGIIFVRIY